MITIISAGPASRSLIQGIRTFLDDQAITVIAPVADMRWYSGGHAAPELDSVMYLFAGLLDRKKSYGIRADTCTTHRFLSAIGHDEEIRVGDKERAVHIARADLLNAGQSLTEATQTLCSGLGIQAAILPATDDDMDAYLETERGYIHLCNFKNEPEEIRGKLVLSWEKSPEATDEVISAINRSDAVIIGPDDPVAGIAPILACKGIREALSGTFVIAVSPFSTEASLRSTGAYLLEAEGLDPSTTGVADLYRGICDLLIQDFHDPTEIPGTLRLETRLNSRARSETLAWDLMTLVRDRSLHQKRENHSF